MEKEQGLLYTAETKPEREWHYGSMLYAYDLTTNQHHSFESDLPEGTYSFAALSGNQLLLLGNDLTYGFVTQEDLYLMDLETKEVVNLSNEQDLAIGNTIIGDFQQKSWCFSNLDQQTTVYCTSDYSWKIAIVPCRYERTMDITI